MDETLFSSLESFDQEIYTLIEKEKERQQNGLELIASENFISLPCLEALGSILTNKYSEGLPGVRYYGGNEHIDAIELLCQQRCLKTFGLSSSEWGVNVQPYSGSTANFAVMTAILNPNDRLMGLDLPHGGHLTHGYQTSKKKISATSIYFQSLPYQTDPETGYIDYDKLEETARLFCPKLLICGASAYPRDWDYVRFRKIADEHNSYLMMDMAHTSGLIAAKQANNPFLYCDIVTTTTHKTLRGPRAGLIFYKKSSSSLDEKIKDLETKINFSVFPSCQGGPHNHQVASIAVAMKHACSTQFEKYIIQVKKNARVLAKRLMEYGYCLVTNGTDNHCILCDLRPQGITGSKVEKFCEKVNISINKNSVPKDKSALSPGGIRLGTPALTSRGMVEHDFEKIGDFLHKCIQLSLSLQRNTDKSLREFIQNLEKSKDIPALRQEIEMFAKKFPMPGMPNQFIK